MTNRNPSVCVVVPVHNRAKTTLRFLRYFTKSSYKNYKIVIVDDGSTDDTSKLVKAKYPQVVMLKGKGDLWWAGATNRGVRYALRNKFTHVLTINDDAIVDKNYLRTLVDCAKKKPNAIIGSLILQENKKKIWALGLTLDFSKFYFGRLNFYNKSTKSVLKKIKNPYHVNSLTGDGTLIPTEIFKTVGLYDEKNFPQYVSDVEFTVRAGKRGFSSFVCLGARLINIRPTNPAFKNKSAYFLNKKSTFYWKTILYSYLVYAPLKYKLNFFKLIYFVLRDY